MKALITILFLVAVGYLAYTYLYVPMTDEEKLIHNLEKRFDEAAILNFKQKVGLL
jgi:hypothetical protein